MERCLSSHVLARTIVHRGGTLTTVRLAMSQPLHGSWCEPCGWDMTSPSVTTCGMIERLKNTRDL